MSHETRPLKPRFCGVFRRPWRPCAAASPIALYPIPLCLCLSLCLSLCAGCFGSGSKGIDPALHNPERRAQKIETLRVEIEADHRSLEDLITESKGASEETLHENVELRAIANRLTGQEDLLEALLSMQADALRDAAPTAVE